jgi:CMP/dCMP kinase
MTYKQILQAIKERDRKDEKMEKSNRAKMLKLGLKLYQPGRIVEVDTGKIEGVANVVAEIVIKIKKTDKIIALQGVSSSGKTSTASTLAKKIKAVHFSFGELFRYLTYLEIEKEVNDWDKIFVQLDYRARGLKVDLYDGKRNVSKELARELRSQEIEKIIPLVAEKTQRPSIEFLAKKISALSQSGVKIVLDGRAFTLDFLPCDLRFKLKCSAVIRAKRRLKQVN